MCLFAGHIATSLFGAIDMPKALQTFNEYFHLLIFDLPTFTDPFPNCFCGAFSWVLIQNHMLRCHMEPAAPSGSMNHERIFPA
jgi:hypothetical protein